MKNELFNYLIARGIFKNNQSSGMASEKTELKKSQRRRGRMLWLAKAFITDPQTKETKIIGKGTYVRAIHGELK